MKLFSIVIPTLNRSKLLKITIEAFLPQITKHKCEVEFIVCNNASDDDTLDVLNMLNQDNLFTIVDYKDRADIGNSIYRSLKNATGEYVVLWGDDDLPCANYVETILSYLSKYDNIGLMHYNRLLGFDDNGGFKKVHLIQDEYPCNETLYNSTDDFLKKFFLDTTFISSIVFKKSYWEASVGMDTTTHYGYEFYAPIMKGTLGHNILYIHYPLCIQRIANVNKRFWSDNAAKCRLLGIPNMLTDMAEIGVITDPYNLWMESPNKMRCFIVALLQAAGFKNKYRKLLPEICKHQNTLFRKFLAYTIVNFAPAKTYSVLKSKYNE